MKRFILDLWDKGLAKLGSFGVFVQMAAAQLKIAIDTDDGEKVRRHGIELIEAGEALKKLGRSVVSATEKDADGVIRITATEGSEILLNIEEALDEIEDVATGIDEDDPVPPAED